MHRTNVIIGSIFVLLLTSTCSLAAEPASEPATTFELPAALRDLDVTADQIVTKQDAQAVRGQWILTLNYPLFATAIEGRGSLELRLTTLSNGIAPGTPVQVWLKIGR